MSKSKEIFSSLMEEALQEEAIQDRIFMESKKEEEYEELKELSNKEIGKIIKIEEEGPKIGSLPF